MNDFRRDDAWQKMVRDSVLGPGFYGSYSLDGRYVFLDKGALATTLQKRFAVDTVLQSKHGKAVFIEEKIVRWPGYRYTAYCLETDSCTKPGFESKGWMHYGQADYLLYCFVLPDRIEWDLIDFGKLREWFWSVHNTLPTFGPLPTLNRTAGRKALIATVKSNVPTWSGTIYPDPESPHFHELFLTKVAA